MNDPACKHAAFEAVERAFDKRMSCYRNVVKIKATSDEAAQKLQNARFDVVYIDGLHTYQQTKRDILNYTPLTTLIAGHDFNQSDWPGVRKAVVELFGESVRQFVDTSWAKALGENPKRLSRSVWSRTADLQLKVVTPFSRSVGNLAAMHRSLCVPAQRMRTEWLIVYQHDTENELLSWHRSQVHEPALTITLIKGRSKTSQFGNSYRNQAIESLKPEPHSWVYFLDDDNIMHPGFVDVMRSLDKTDEVVFFAQVGKDYKLRLAPLSIRVGAIDTAMFLTRADVISLHRWRESEYTADGILAEQLAREHRSRTVCAPCCFYNYLA